MAIALSWQCRHPLQFFIPTQVITALISPPALSLSLDLDCAHLRASRATLPLLKQLQQCPQEVLIIMDKVTEAPIFEDTYFVPYLVPI